MTNEQMQEIAKNVAAEIVEKSRGERGAVVTKSETSKFSALKSCENFGAFLKTVANAKGGGREEVVKQASRFGGAEMAKAIQESVYDSAGVLVPVQTANEVIEFLRPVSLMDKLGIRTVAFKSQLEIPKQTGTASLAWIGEGDTVAETKPTFGKIILKAHKAMALLNLSNDLLRNPAVGDAFAGEDARLAMAHGLDDAMLNGTGLSGQPTGLIKQINSANSYVRAGTSIANYIGDADKAVEKVLSADVAITAPAWLMSPRRKPSCWACVMRPGTCSATRCSGTRPSADSPTSSRPAWRPRSSCSGAGISSSTGWTRPSTCRFTRTRAPPTTRPSSAPCCVPTSRFVRTRRSPKSRTANR